MGNDEDVKNSFKKLWKSYVSRQAQSIVRKLIRGRLATKDDLIKRGLFQVVGNPVCPLDSSEEESISHLFSNALSLASHGQDIFNGFRCSLLIMKGVHCLS